MTVDTSVNGSSSNIEKSEESEGDIAEASKTEVMNEVAISTSQSNSVFKHSTLYNYFKLFVIFLSFITILITYELINIF